MALAPSLTSASIVGFPRESKICRPLISRIALMLPPQAAEKDQHSTRPAQARQDAPFPNLRSRLDKILNGDPAASPLGGAHRLGAPYSSHRAPQRVRLRFSLPCGLVGCLFEQPVRPQSNPHHPHPSFLFNNSFTFPGFAFPPEAFITCPTRNPSTCCFPSLNCAT